jgi:hypothetical protein
MPCCVLNRAGELRCRPVPSPMRFFCAVLLVVLASGCTSTPKQPGLSLAASHDREWLPSLAVLPWAEMDGDQMTVRNIRAFRYVDEETFVRNYYDRTYDLRDLESIDFIVVPFKDKPNLAHTMLSFGFVDDQYLAVSVEARLEAGENYESLKGFINQFELMYVVADERDVIPLRTKHREVDVYVYRAKSDPRLARAMFTDVMERVNQIADQPEYYNTLTNNCTTNIREHVNRLRPGRVPWDWRVLLPGHSDRLAYDLGLLDTHRSFEETRQRAKITEVANAHLEAADFSVLIRR